MNPLFKASTLLLLPFILTSCLQTGGGDSPLYAVIQDLEVECAVDAVPTCNSSGKTIYVGLTSDTDVNCESYMQVLNSNNFAFSFDASGTTSSNYDGIAVRGTVSSWVGEVGQSIGELEKRSYKVCAFMDVNANGQLDVNEPAGSGTLSPGGTSVDLTDWFSHFALPEEQI